MGNLFRTIAPNIWFSSLPKDTKGMVALVLSIHIPHQEGYNISRFFFLTLGSAWKGFYACWQAFYPFILSIICNSILTLILSHTAWFICVWPYYFSFCVNNISFLSSSTSPFLQLHTGEYLSLFHACGPAHNVLCHTS